MSHNSHNAHEQLQSPRSSGQRSGATRAAPNRWATAAALLTLALGQVAQAADGQLDPSFDGDGLVILDVGNERNEFQALAVQRDGKIVAAGSVGIVTSRDFAVARFNPDGSLDLGFGTGGINSTTDVSGADLRDFAEALALQADGKIVLAGQSGPEGAEQFAIARYNPDGSLDDGSPADSTPGDEFGVNGTRLTPFPGGRSIARE
ncbi:MAG: delta-60 repeat domain-containing protein, partial [bacterium]